MRFTDKMQAYIAPKTNTKLAMLASMAVAMQKLPLSARDVVNQPKLVKREEPKWVHPKFRKPNTNGLNRKARRRLAALAVHGELKPQQKRGPRFHVPKT